MSTFEKLLIHFINFINFIIYIIYILYKFYKLINNFSEVLINVAFFIRVKSFSL